MPAPEKKKRSFVQVSKCRAKKAWVRLKGKFLPTQKRKDYLVGEKKNRGQVGVDRIRQHKKYHFVTMKNGIGFHKIPPYHTKPLNTIRRFTNH